MSDDAAKIAALAYMALVNLHQEVHDFSDSATLIMAAVTAKIGGIDQLVAGRPGSWESSYLREWMQSAGADLPEVGHLEYAQRLERILQEMGENP